MRVGARLSGGPTGPRRVVFVLWLLVFVAGTQTLIIAPLIPQISAQLGTPEPILGTLITAYAVSVGVIALVTGPISDRIGRRRILLVGSTLLAVALLAHGLTWDFASLFAARALAGVAGGILNGASVAYIGDYFEPERRGWANGWLFTGFAAGSIAGIPLGTLAAEAFGYRVPFLAFGLLLVGVLVLQWRYLPAPDVQLTDHLSVESAVAGYAELLRRRDVLAAVAVFVVMFGGNALYTTFLPTWLVVSVGASGGAIATMFFVGGIGNVLSGPRAGMLSDRVGRKRVIVAASLGLAVTMAATTLLVDRMLVAYAVFFVVMGLFAARATPFTTLMIEMVESDRRGSFLNLTVGMGQMASGVGGALAGAAYATVGYPGTTVVGALAMVVIAVLVWAFLPETAGQAASPNVEAPVGPTPDPVLADVED